MENDLNCKIKMNTIIKEKDSWKETALVAGNPKIMRSIEKSLKQIALGKGIPLNEL